MRASPRALPLVALSALSLLLGGCTTAGAPAASPSPSASADAPAPSPSPTPAPDATPPAPIPSSPPAEAVDPRPPYEELVVSTAGLGPLTIDAPVETNPGAAMIVWEPNACGSWDPENPGRWVSTYTRTDGSNPLGVDVHDGTVGWIDILEPGPRTAEGVGLGTDLATLRAAYPDLVAGTPGPVSNVWWIGDERGYVKFETRGDNSPQSAGTPEQVVVMTVLSPAGAPDFAAANTDFVAGGCF